MKIDHPQDPNLTTEILQADVNAAKTKFSSNDWCFTWVTVQTLLDKIKNMEYQARLCDIKSTASDRQPNWEQIAKVDELVASWKK